MKPRPAKKRRLEEKPDGYQCLNCGQFSIGRKVVSCPTCGGTDLRPFVRRKPK